LIINQYVLVEIKEKFIFIFFILICFEPINHGNATDIGEQIFQDYCASCHTIGKGILVGPDLAGVTSRREESWLFRQIKEPNLLIEEKDPIAIQLLQEFDDMPMVELGLEDAEEMDGVIYSGLAKKHFVRSFILGDHIKVNEASFQNGLLTIDLERQVPEEKKPELIEIH